jgi:hypothetical protein
VHERVGAHLDRSGCRAGDARLYAGWEPWERREARTVAGGMRAWFEGGARVTLEGPARLDGLLALGAVELADADPLLDAALAEAVHARRGDALLEVAEADRAPELLERVGREAGDPHAPRPPLSRLRLGLLRTHLGRARASGTGRLHAVAGCMYVVAR